MPHLNGFGAGGSPDAARFGARMEIGDKTGAVLQTLALPYCRG